MEELAEGKKKDLTPKYDFQKMIAMMRSDLKNEQKEAFILSLRPLAVEGVKDKCKILRKRILKVALLSSTVGLIPIPGVSASVDMGLLIEEIVFYIKALKLTEKQIKETASSFNVNYDSLKRDVIVRNPFFNSILSIMGNLDINILKVSFKIIIPLIFTSLSGILLGFLSKQIALNTVEEGVKAAAAIVPVIGTVIASIVGAGISFGTTFISLTKVLENFENTLVEIIEYCIKNRRRI